MMSWIAIIMIAMLTLFMPMGLTSVPDNAAAAQPVEPADAPSVEAVDPDAYRGQWVSSEALEIELFLPEGWTGEDQTAGEDAAYVARSADGEVRMFVQNVGALEADQDFEDWAEWYMDGHPYEITSANGEVALLSREAGLLIATPCGADIYAFTFEPQDAIPEALALRIAGSCTSDW